MFCSKCGTKLNQSDSICPNCGDKPNVKSSSSIHKSTIVAAGISVLVIGGFAASFAIGKISSGQDGKAPEVQVNLENNYESSKPDEANKSETKSIPEPAKENLSAEPSKVSNASSSHTSVANSQIENEVSKIRKIYNIDSDAIDSNNYDVSYLENGSTVYSRNGSTKRIDVPKGLDDIPYSRSYTYSEGSLIFAYIESSDSHRLYFKNDTLFRWRYAQNAGSPDNAINHDNSFDSNEYVYWSDIAVEDGYKYLYKANN